MKRGPATIEISERHDAPRDQDRETDPPARTLPGNAHAATPPRAPARARPDARALDEHAVAGREQSPAPARGGLGVEHPLALGHPSASRDRRALRSPTAEHGVDAELRGAAPDLAVVALRSRRRARPSSPSTATVLPAGGTLELGARAPRASRSGWRCRQSLIRSPPRGQRRSPRRASARAESSARLPARVQRQPERVVGDERGERVLGLVTGAQRKLQLEPLALDLEDGVRRSRSPGSNETSERGSARAEATQVEAGRDEGLQQRLARGHDRDPAGRQRAKQLRLRLRDPPRPCRAARGAPARSLVITTDVRSDEARRPRAIWPRPRIADLDDRQLGVRLDAADA